MHPVACFRSFTVDKKQVRFLNIQMAHFLWSSSDTLNNPGISAATLTLLSFLVSCLTASTSRSLTFSGLFYPEFG